MDVEWDPAKARANRRKHGLSFEEAADLLRGDASCLDIYDDSDEDEERFLAIGPIRRGIIVVVYADRQDDVLRIISARMATKREMELFRRYRDSGHE